MNAYISIKISLLNRFVSTQRE